MILTAGLALTVVLSACSVPPPDDGDPNPPPPPNGPIQFVQRVSGLATPVALTNASDERLFVAERAGTVRIIRNGALLSAPFLDMTGLVASSSGEQGLLGLAFPPDHGDSGRFYLYYTNASGRGVLARAAVSEDDPNVADPSSLETLIQLPETSTYHNGGQLEFGPDGYLYWAVGDGGNGASAQSLTSLRGKILRLDVSAADGYLVPGTNPFVDTAGARSEIWAYGLRNPWRFSFDADTGELYIADVGQNAFEEVNVAPAGAGGQNYGWPIMEGASCYTNPSCDSSGLTLPSFTYAHPSTGGASITGGYVYRGPAAPDLVGRYVFADYVHATVSVATLTTPWQVTKLLEGPWSTASFGVGADGRLYVTDYGGGAVYEITQKQP